MKAKTPEEEADYQRRNFPVDEASAEAALYAEAARLRDLRKPLSDGWQDRDLRQNGWTPPQVLVHHHLGNSGRKSVMEAV